MGSLMSGWSSTVLGDDKKVRLMRNRSLTKEEVDAFWRQHGRPDTASGQQQQQPGSPLGSPRAVVSPPLCPSPRQQQSPLSSFEACRRQLDGTNGIVSSRSLPPLSPLARGAGSSSQQLSAVRSEPSSPAARAEGFPDSPSTSSDWWTRSSWAFLNEPPHNKQEEEETIASSVSGRGGRTHETYASDQFIVHRIVTGNA